MHPETSETNHLNGIRGWLIFPLISLILYPLFSLTYILSELTYYFEPDYWYYITTHGTDLYHPLFAPMIIYELIINIALILIPILLLFLMFKRSRYFPKAMIIFLIGGIVCHFIDAYFAYHVFSSIPMNGDDSEVIIDILFGDTLRVLIPAAIWIPYFIYSKRVKATFLEDKTNRVSEVVFSKELSTANTVEPQNNQQANKKGWLPIVSYTVNILLVITIFLVGYTNYYERKLLEQSNSALSQENEDLENSYNEIKEELSSKETNNLTTDGEKNRLLSDLEALQEENTKLKNEINSLQKTIAQITPEQSTPSDPVKENTASTDLIDIGSTKEDVRRIMGTPSAIQDYEGFFSVWNYGTSTIRFDENDKVEGWRNYGNNLKLK